MAASLGTPGPSWAQGLNLAERRALAQFEQQRLPGLLAEVRAAAGFEVPVDIRWNELAISGDAQYFNDDDYWVVIFFRPLVAALRGVASDAMGREALAAKLRQIVLRYDQATAPVSNYRNGVSFEGGVLTINFRPRANVADVEPRARAIRATLEAGL